MDEKAFQTFNKNSIIFSRNLLKARVTCGENVTPESAILYDNWHQNFADKGFRIACKETFPSLRLFVANKHTTLKMFKISVL